jgi:hypothetical protein
MGKKAMDKVVVKEIRKDKRKEREEKRLKRAINVEFTKD